MLVSRPTPAAQRRGGASGGLGYHKRRARMEFAVRQSSSVVPPTSLVRIDGCPLAPLFSHPALLLLGSSADSASLPVALPPCLVVHLSFVQKGLIPYVCACCAPLAFESRTEDRGTRMTRTRRWWLVDIPFDREGGRERQRREHNQQSTIKRQGQKPDTSLWLQDG